MPNPSLDRKVIPRATYPRMIKTLAIERFRCFAGAALPDCRRINLIVGDNASGKTSLLEALFLVAGPSPELAIRLRQWRGFEGQMIGTQYELEAALWTDLFYNFDQTLPVHINAHGNVAHTRRLTIFRHAPPPPAVGRKAGKPIIADQAPVTFKWNISRHAPIEITPRVVNGGIWMPPLIPAPTEVFFFPANHTYSSVEAATRLSKLSKESADFQVTDSFKKHYPKVESLSLELSSGAPMVYCKLSAFKQKIPLNTVSGGMNKLAAILLSFPTSPGCIVLIDEIENGFYFRRFPEIWRTLRTFCEDYNAQVFASTHSAECLSAAADVAEKYPEDFSVIHSGDGVLRQFHGDKFLDAMNENIEIR